LRCTVKHASPLPGQGEITPPAPRQCRADQRAVGGARSVSPACRGRARRMPDDRRHRPMHKTCHSNPGNCWRRRCAGLQQLQRRDTACPHREIAAKERRQQARPRRARLSALAIVPDKFSRCAPEFRNFLQLAAGLGTFAVRAGKRESEQTSTPRSRRVGIFLSRRRRHTRSRRLAPMPWNGIGP